MEGKYDIFRGPYKIGKGEIHREGLYYRVRCWCDLTGEVIYRLTVTCGDSTENLGIPVPAGDSFYLEKRLPINRFSSGTPVIQAVPRHSRGQFVPVSPEETFTYLNRLKQAVFEKRDGIAGVLIKDL